MPAAVHSSLHAASIVGGGARLVEVQVDLALGLPGFHLVGLPDHACIDARTRVLTAIRNAGFALPQKKITVNLAPGDLRKEGASFDLPIALGILCAAGLLQAPPRPPLVIGEVSLSGDLLPVRGVLPVALEARRLGFAELIVPDLNAAEAAHVQGLAVYGARTLVEAAELFAGTVDRVPVIAAAAEEPEPFAVDFSDVRGQDAARSALELAAAGGHNALLVGPPGAGKTMLARRLPTILPPLSFEEAVEATTVWSIAGRLKAGQGLLAMPPFRAPHHTISAVGLVGGGTPLRPGEISLAHRGVLFMDELPEFGRFTLEALRQPLEDGEVSLVRAKERAVLPARFMLVAAMNPCPCGQAMDPDPERCTCSLPQKQAYLARVSGPILDRLDLHVEVGPVRPKDLAAKPEGQKSSEIRERVVRARLIQRERYAGLPGVHCNAQLRGPALREMVSLTRAGAAKLAEHLDKSALSARSHDRILKVARTAADLHGCAQVTEDHINEAVQWRCLDKPITGRPARPRETPRDKARLAVLRSPGNPPGEHPREGT